MSGHEDTRQQQMQQMLEKQKQALMAERERMAAMVQAEQAAAGNAALQMRQAERMQATAAAAEEESARAKEEEASAREVYFREKKVAAQRGRERDARLMAERERMKTAQEGNDPFEVEVDMDAMRSARANAENESHQRDVVINHQRDIQLRGMREDEERRAHMVAQREMEAEMNALRSARESAETETNQDNATLFRQVFRESELQLRAHQLQAEEERAAMMEAQLVARKREVEQRAMAAARAQEQEKWSRIRAEGEVAERMQASLDASQGPQRGEGQQGSAYNERLRLAEAQQARLAEADARKRELMWQLEAVRRAEREQAELDAMQEDRVRAAYQQQKREAQRYNEGVPEPAMNLRGWAASGGFDSFYGAANPYYASEAQAKPQPVGSGMRPLVAISHSEAEGRQADDRLRSARLGANEGAADEEEEEIFGDKIVARMQKLEHESRQLAQAIEDMQLKLDKDQRGLNAQEVAAMRAVEEELARTQELLQSAKREFVQAHAARARPAAAAAAARPPTAQARGRSTSDSSDSTADSPLSSGSGSDSERDPASQIEQAMEQLDALEERLRDRQEELRKGDTNADQPESEMKQLMKAMEAAKERLEVLHERKAVQEQERRRQEEKEALDGPQARGIRKHKALAEKKAAEEAAAAAAAASQKAQPKWRAERDAMIGAMREVRSTAEPVLPNIPQMLVLKSPVKHAAAPAAAAVSPSAAAAPVTWISGGVQPANRGEAVSARSKKFAQKAEEFRRIKELRAAQAREEDNNPAKVRERLAQPALQLTRYASELFVDPSSSALEDFECAICLCVAFDPPVLEVCVHQHCRACLLEWGRTDCPTCTQSFAGSALLSQPPDAPVWSLVVKCRLASRGCEWTGPLGVGNSNLVAHNGECAFVQVLCPSCRAAVERRGMAAHQEGECAERLVKCAHCASTVRAKLMARHQAHGDEGPCSATRYCPFGCVSPRGAGGVSVHPLAAVEAHQGSCVLRPVECIVCASPHVLPFGAMKAHLHSVTSLPEAAVHRMLESADELSKLKRAAGISVKDAKAGGVHSAQSSASPSPVKASAAADQPSAKRASITNAVLPAASLALPSTFDAAEPLENALRSRLQSLRMAVSGAVPAAAARGATPGVSPVVSPALSPRNADLLRSPMYSPPALNLGAVPAYDPAAPTLRLVFHLPDIHPNRSIDYPLGLGLGQIRNFAPFSALYGKTWKVHLISDDGKDWDELHPSTTPQELGLEPGTRIGLKIFG